MAILEAQPKLTDLHRLIARVPSYPISVGQLIKLAVSIRANREVIDFYMSFPDDAIFNDEDDLVGRTEQIEIMELDDQPDENIIRGAED